MRSLGMTSLWLTFFFLFLMGGCERAISPPRVDRYALGGAVLFLDVAKITY